MLADPLAVAVAIRPDIAATKQVRSESEAFRKVLSYCQRSVYLYMLLAAPTWPHADCSKASHSESTVSAVPISIEISPLGNYSFGNCWCVQVRCEIEVQGSDKVAGAALLDETGPDRFVNLLVALDSSSFFDGLVKCVD